MGVMPVPPAIMLMWRAACGSSSSVYLRGTAALEEAHKALR